MSDNVYKFRRTKWADPKPLDMTAGFKPKPRGSRYFAGMVVVCALLSFVAVLAALKLGGEPNVMARTESAAPASISVSVHVIDGDTVSLNDGRPNVRLVGFNAPETGRRALCEAERKKGEAAGQRLRELVRNGRPEFQQVACSCPAGTEGTNACNFGRRCGTLRVNGVDVGSTLIGEGLAVRFVCSATSCPALPRPWC
jgi:endonuclease YncB( thermonuclease family)